MIKNVYLSHTAAHVVLFPLLLRVPWHQAPWPTSTQGFSDPIRLLFRRGGERAESKFSYTVAVIFVSIQALITQHSSSQPLSDIHRRSQEHLSGYHLRNQHDSEEARKPGDHRHWSEAFELRRRKQCGPTWGRRVAVNHLTPNDHYMGRTAQLTSRCCILCIYSTNIHTEHFKHAA